MTTWKAYDIPNELRSLGEKTIKENKFNKVRDLQDWKR